MCCKDAVIAGYIEEIHELRIMVKELQKERDELLDELTGMQYGEGDDG